MVSTDLENQLTQLQMHAAHDRAEIARLQAQIGEQTRADYLRQKNFAQSLQNQQEANQAMAATVLELNTRLKMLLTSRLLHMVGGQGSDQRHIGQIPPPMN